MKFLLFFLTCMLVAVQSFGQNQNTNGNNVNVKPPVNNNSSTEEREEIQIQEKPALKEVKVTSEKKKAEAVSQEMNQTEQSRILFSNMRKMATTQMSSRSPSPAQQQEMNKAINYYKANAPESFEYHYFTYTAGNYNTSLYPHLKKAAELKPTNSDVIVQLAAYNTIAGNKTDAKKNLKELVSNGKLSDEVLSYDTDLLNSVPQNGVLITHGFDDGFGSLYMNSVKELRKDVKIISLDFMQSKAYRDSLKKDGFNMPASTVIDVAFLNEFCKKNEQKKLFLSMTFPKPYFTEMADKLYVHGLVFAYGEKGKDLQAENEALWAKLLKAKFIYKADTEKGKGLTSNYLPMLFYLRELYETNRRTKDLNNIDKAIDQIGMQSNKLSKVNSIRGKN